MGKGDLMALRGCDDRQAMVLKKDMTVKGYDRD